MMRGQQRRVRSDARAAAAAVRVRDELHALRNVPLECSAQRYSTGAAALFFRSNWVGRDGLARVVLACDAALPGSERRAAVLLWSGNDVEQVDLSEEPLESLVRRGRLFVFTATAEFSNGHAYAVLPATFQQSADGPLGAWSFATAGSFRGRPFVLGRGAVGTFAEPTLRHVMLARPIQLDVGAREWVWMGRSSDVIKSRLRFRIDLPLDADPRARVVFELPGTVQRPDVALVRCTATDDRGDPIGVVDTHAARPYRIVRADGVPYLVARPNQRDQQGRLVFAALATPNVAGESVLVVPFRDGEVDVDVELAANHARADGTRWFVRYPNVKDRATGHLLVRIALRAS
jgi:hypothetical protein